MNYIIQIKNLKKRFDTKWVTKDVNLDIPEGKMTVIIGQSGQGKSVLLKQIIGLIKPTSGSVYVAGENIVQLEEHELDRVFSKFGYVFQFAALLDSLTVFENVGITLLEQGVDHDYAHGVVLEKIRLVNLQPDCLDKYPSELSGGMRKRVGLARTLIANPSIILYDEPTTGLDPITTRVIHELMFSMQEHLQVTSVIISHDISIFDYADYIALLHDGVIKFFGPAKTIWESKNPYVYQFIRGKTEGPIHTELSEG